MTESVFSECSALQSGRLLAAKMRWRCSRGLRAPYTSSRKYSLVANSVKLEVIIEPSIGIV
jgi:hypothetical protein